MDSQKFDTLTRAFRSRRTTLGLLLGSGAILLGLAEPDPATAHDPAAACRKLPNQATRRRCLRRAAAHRRRCHATTTEAICAGRCGTWPGPCGTVTTCPACASPKECLGNGSCAQRCPSPACPTGCLCAIPLVEGGTVCIPNNGRCSDLQQECEATTECPVGQACLRTACSPQPGLGPDRCTPLCQV